MLLDVLPGVSIGAPNRWKELVGHPFEISICVDFKATLQIDGRLAIEPVPSALFDRLRQVVHDDRRQNRPVTDEDVLSEEWVEDLEEDHEASAVHHEEILCSDHLHVKHVLGQTARLPLGGQFLVGQPIERALLEAVQAVVTIDHADVLLERNAEHLLGSCDFFQAVQD